MARPTNFKLGIRMEDDDPQSATGAMTSKVMIISSHCLYISSLSLLKSGKQNAVPVSLEAGKCHTLSAEPQTQFLFRSK